MTVLFLILTILNLMAFPLPVAGSSSTVELAF